MSCSENPRFTFNIIVHSLIYPKNNTQNIFFFSKIYSFDSNSTHLQQIYRVRSPNKKCLILGVPIRSTLRTYRERPSSFHSFTDACGNWGLVVDYGKLFYNFRPCFRARIFFRLFQNTRISCITLSYIVYLGREESDSRKYENTQRIIIIVIHTIIIFVI